MDAILAEHKVFVVEVNPRFQGSSRLSAVLDSQSDRADMFLAHIGAFLNLSPADRLASIDLLQRPLAAHIVVHASASRTLGDRSATTFPDFEVDLVSDEGVTVEAGAILANLVTRSTVTADGTSLSSAARSAVEVWNA